MELYNYQYMSKSRQQWQRQPSSAVSTIMQQSLSAAINQCNSSCQKCTNVWCCKHRVPCNQTATKTILKASVETMLQAIDSAPLTCHQNVPFVFKQGVCPHFTFSISFLNKVIQPIVTWFLKRWTSSTSQSSSPFPTCPKGRVRSSYTDHTLQKTASVPLYLAALINQWGKWLNIGSKLRVVPVKLAQSVLESHSDLRQKAEPLIKRTHSCHNWRRGEFGVLFTRSTAAREAFDGNMAALWARCVGSLPPCWACEVCSECYTWDTLHKFQPPRGETATCLLSQNQGRRKHSGQSGHGPTNNFRRKRAWHIAVGVASQHHACPLSSLVDRCSQL